jgi:hypothetical protein
MGEPTVAEVGVRLAESFELDRQWRMTMDLPEGDTKEPALRLICALLDRERVAYAVIGGLAVQLHSQEPRTTRDIDLVVKTFDDVPSRPLLAAGFEYAGRFAHSDNWYAPGAGPAKLRTPVQFSVEEIAAGVVDRATVVMLGAVPLRLVMSADLLLLKLRAAEDPSRRSSKRATDVADILRLVEDDPTLRDSVPDFSSQLGRIQARILGSGDGR